MRLSYANVTATLALFVALGGSGYAATKIRGKDIAKRTIAAKHVKKGTLTGSEIARGSITQSKLSRGVRARLPAEGDSGFPGQDSLPPLDGRDGLPGEPGREGEPGPPGSGCGAEQGLLCGDADLPAGQTAVLDGGGTLRFRATAYRTSCTKDAPPCVVLLAGEAPAKEAADWYESGDARNVTLSIGPTSGPVAPRFTIATAQPTELRYQTDRYQLTLSAATVVETAPRP